MPQVYMWLLYLYVVTESTRMAESAANAMRLAENGGGEESGKIMWLPGMLWHVRGVRFQIDLDCAVGDVAGHCRVSLRLLELRFKAILNHGVRDEIENVRLENVKQMLRETGLSIKEIGYHCGFPSSAGLCTVFKRKFGKSPQVWRTDEHLNRKALTSTSIKRVSDFTHPGTRCKTSYSTL